ncbi:3-hydroxyacyl-CoA dehydrogenase/enoyl-CoA hydratase family protein [Tissierella praeacuta]|uniref:3-hydroxyacyl-CoA dehydrogenase/enoyl-CoA hydratase family protein n=1 Tax=Tissierella praeacuta TaxID=43131 RepID=UPI0035163A72
MVFKINKVAILGSGVMGSSIAAHIVGAGIPVLLLDMQPTELNEEDIKLGLNKDSYEFKNKLAINGKKGVLSSKSKSIYDKDLGHMIELGNFQEDLDRISECDWIIEVIVEDLYIKKQMIKQINKYKKDGAIVSSNTSSISINLISEDMDIEFRRNFLGTHFFNPPRYMRLLELIPNKDTDENVIKFMAEFGSKRLGKGVVIAKDTPSFIANRIGGYSIINAINIGIKYGFTIPKVDQLTGDIIGRPKSATYRTMDMVGLDVLKFVAEGISNVIDDKKEIEELKLPTFILDLVRKGYLGDKSKQGFYKKIKEGQISKTLVWDIDKQDYVEFERENILAISEARKSYNKIANFIYGDSIESKFAWEIVKNILLYSGRKAYEISDDYKDIDKAMRWGYNWEIGPFQLWDLIGFEKSLNRMKEEGEDIPSWIEDRLINEKLYFYDKGSLDLPYVHLESSNNKVLEKRKDGCLLDIGDDVLLLQITSKANSITSGVLEILSYSLEEAERNYKGLVVGNEGGNFSVGANLLDISILAKEKRWSDLDALVANFQKVNLDIKCSKIPVVAAPYNMTLGGGAELALHASRIVSHVELYMGLVELGVGLVPGGGGSKELLFRAMEGLDRFDLIEMTKRVTKVWELIVKAKVSSSAYEAKKNGYLSSKDKIVMNIDYLLDESKKEVIRINDEGYRQFIKKNILAIGKTGRANLQYIIQSMEKGGFISEYDAYLADKVAYILSGGDVLPGTEIGEEYILKLEREVFVELCKEKKTQERMEYMLRVGKPLRN